MALDRPGTDFKGPRSLSNPFERFFDQKFEIGHFGWTLKTKACTKTVLQVSSQSVRSQIVDQKIAQIDLKDFLDP